MSLNYLNYDKKCTFFTQGRGGVQKSFKRIEPNEIPEFGKVRFRKYIWVSAIPGMNV